MVTKILVVDDEPQIGKVLKAYLERAGYQVVVEVDGQAAIEVSSTRSRIS
jgi:DNA-binding response OmpR family regulator